MKTLLRYLAGTKPMVLTLRPKIIPHSKQTTFDIDTYVDSDWAGCATSRRSTSGMALYFLGALITSQSRTQATVALSSGEAVAFLFPLRIALKRVLSLTAGTVFFISAHASQVL